MLTKYTQLRDKVDKALLLLGRIPADADKYSSDSDNEHLYTNYIFQRQQARVELANQLRDILK